MLPTPTPSDASGPGGRDRDQQDAPLLLSVRQAAALLGIGTTLCWEMVYSKQLPTVRFGRRVLIPRIAVERLAGVSETTWPEVG